ncbi:hypothetical protein BST81_21730 [Leptolyngbya sp. 'hensonii']|uniref:GAF domain-containing sensor histidine kinase n=1 Tax=Leptolyngbya sp. 'hensonii' TaxID=1922337 RepID=UPI000965B26C|nr:ATP-binding protein [Leptolyngbya sp. 'hensonii']OLP16227.1 hypothetical protein BST81_21730 [Leptolyngbya sp. 'hensonii']
MSPVETLSYSQTKDAAPKVLISDTSPHTSPQMTHWANSIEMLKQLALILRTSSDPQVILPFISYLLGREFQVECCLVAARNTSQSTLQVGCSRDGEEAALYQVSHQVMEHPLIEVLSTHFDPLAIADTQAFEIGQLLEGQYNGIPARAILAISTQFQGEWNGFIALMRSQPYYWMAQEIDLLRKITDQVALAIAQIGQIQSSHSLQQQMLASSRRQALLEKLILATRDATELDEVLKLATQETAQALQVDRATTLLLKYPDTFLKLRGMSTDEPGVLRAKANVAAEWSATLTMPNSPVQPPQPNQYSPNSPQPISFLVSDCSLCQPVLLNAPAPLEISCLETWIAERYSAGADISPSIAPIFNAKTMPAVVLVPLESQNTLLGLLVLQHHQVRPWQPEELVFLELVAAQISTAIIQTQTLRQVQALVDERTAQLQRSLEVQAKLYETTRRQIDQLRHLNQMKDEFLSTVSHELLTPLTSMTLAIRMLRQANLTPERQAKYLDILEKQCAQETNLINDLLALQRLESQQTTLQVQRIDIQSLINDLTHSFDGRWPEKRLTITTDLPQRPLALQSDQQGLQQVLTELLTNAGKYAAPGTTIQLQVSHQVEQGISQIVFNLSNIGLGISLEDLPYIFNKFRRGQGATQQAIPGTGLGLALVKFLVQNLNGTITASSQPLEGTNTHEVRFKLTIPQFHDRTLPVLG